MAEMSDMHVNASGLRWLLIEKDFLFFPWPTCFELGFLLSSLPNGKYEECMNIMYVLIFYQKRLVSDDEANTSTRKQHHCCFLSRHLKCMALATCRAVTS
jgi:hypothetical protein